MTEAGDRLPEVRDLLLVIRRRRVAVLLVAAVVTLALVLLSARNPPRYTAGTRITVHPVLTDIRTDQDAPAPGVALLAPEPTIDTQVEVLRSRLIAARVVAALKLATPADQLAASIRVEAITDELLQVSATAARPALAAALANEVVRQYGAYRRDRRAAELAALGAQLRTSQIRLQRHAAELARRTAAAAPGTPDRARLTWEQRSTLAQLGAVQAGLRTVTASVPLANASVEVVDPARPPDRPSGLTPERAAALGLFAGLFLGVATAFLRDHLDPRIWGRLDAERAAGLQVVAAIPRVPRQRARLRPSRHSDLRGTPRGTEAAYHRLRLLLQAQGLGSAARRVLVVAATPTEGASTVTAGLAGACAAGGIPVVAVAADLTEPGLERRFGIVPGGPGLADALGSGTAARPEWIRPVAPDLWLLPSGRAAARHGEPLRGPGWSRVLDLVDPTAQVVLIDAPPLLTSGEAAAIAPWVDAIVLVVRVGTARPSAVAQALSMLAQIGPATCWVVVNGAERRDGSSPVAGATAWPHPARPAREAPGNGSGGTSRARLLARPLADPSPGSHDGG
jgi:Mrp family chromosome partitioning ATPase